MLLAHVTETLCKINYIVGCKKRGGEGGREGGGRGDLERQGTLCERG